MQTPGTYRSGCRACPCLCPLVCLLLCVCTGWLHHKRRCCHAVRKFRKRPWSWCQPWGGTLNQNHGKEVALLVQDKYFGISNIISSVQFEYRLLFYLTKYSKLLKIRACLVIRHLAATFSMVRGRQMHIENRVNYLKTQQYLIHESNTREGGMAPKAMGMNNIKKYFMSAEGE